MNRLQLREWRTKRWLSQPALGELLGVSKTTVFRWESGESTIAPYLDLALAHLDNTYDFTPAGYTPLHARGVA